jgi:hypothetical protein
MKGKLHKSHNGWTVIYEDIARLYPFTQYVIKEIPVEPYHKPKNEMDGQEVEFQIENFWETGLEEVIKVATIVY